MIVSYSELVKQIVVLDGRVRFAGVTNMLGKIVASHYRKGLAPLLSEEETEKSIPQSVLKSSLRPANEEKLGRSLYSITIYERIKRAMIPLYDQYGNLLSILLISFDADATGSEVESILLDRILPLVRGNDERHRSRR